MSADAPVHVVPYDTSWPAQFEAERAGLQNVLAPWLKGPIEHVGSTAVAGLCAKPVIDIMCGVASLTESEPAKRVLHEFGYEYVAYRTDVMHWFCKPSHLIRTHHLHLVPFRSPLWRERLAFRDLLRANAELADQYGELKIALARQFELDRDAYTEGKTSFILHALEQHSSGTGA